MTGLTGRSRRAEYRTQQRLLDAADARFRGGLEAVIASASREMVVAFAATSASPQMPDNLYGRMERVYLDMASITIDAFGGRVLDQGKRMGLVVETKGFAEFFQRLALEYIAQEAIRMRIASVTLTTRNIIIDAIQRGQEAGDSVDVIASRLEDLIPRMSRTRGALIARTETHGAANYGAHHAAKATGLTLRKEWVSAEDHRTRDFGEGDGDVDEFNHRAANGQIVDMDQPFRIARRNGTSELLMFPGDPNGSPGNTINCFAPWQSVSTAGLKAAMKRKYVGDLVEVSVAGVVNLTVTPNHPVLTDKGWKASGKIVEGDKLVYCLAADAGAIRTSPYVTQGLSSAEDIYNSAQSLVGVVRPDSGVVDLHGEVPNHDVNIVSFDGELRNAFKSFGREVFHNLSLSDTNISKGLLLLDRMGLLSNGASPVKPDSLMRSGGSSFSLLDGLELSSQEVALAYGWPVNPEINEACVDHRSRDIEHFTDAINGIALTNESGNILVYAEPDHAPSFGGSSFEFVECSGVKTLHYDGPVYNFETDTGLIVSSGIVNHNCRCVVAHQVVE